MLALLLAVGGVVLAQTQPPTRESPLYAPMTFSIDIDASLYQNPFDSSDIELVGVFQSPSGRQVIVPGFWMQPYADQCQQPCSVEDLQPSGDPTWQVRYAPDELGHWSYNLQVRDDGTTIRNQSGEFNVTPSDHPGFIQVSANQRYFQYASGQSYFPIGNDLLWSWDGGGGLVTYQQKLQALSEAGGNYARLLIDDPWFIGFEWNGAAGDYRASQKEAARLDAILDMASQYGIDLELVILWHQALINYTGAPVNVPETPARPDMSADWDNSGYNVRNGGPLSGPALFFSDDTAKALFRERLRYIAGRWGFSPQIFSWELVDEIDHTSNYSSSVASDWLQDMAGYLRQVDQDRHLITAGSRNDDPVIAESPALSFTEARFFQRRPVQTTGDQVVGALGELRQNLQLVNAPALLTQFSLNPWYEPTADDPNGISVQDSLWAAAFSGAGGGGMSAWGETDDTPLKFYPALAAFASEVDWAHLNLAPAEAALLNPDATLYQPLRISRFVRGFGKPAHPAQLHLITPDAVLPDVSDVSSYLYGEVYNKDWHQPQLYRVTVPTDTYFEARVRSTSTQAGARLAISVDGSIAAELVLDAGAGGVALRVPLTVGEHDVTLENLGDDWLELDSIEIGQMVAPVRSLTLRDSSAGVALSWLQYRSYTWDQADQPRPLLLFDYRLDHMPPGRYSVEIWSPITGAVIGGVLTRVGADGVLQVELVPMDDELAIRAVRQPGAETPTPSPSTFSIATNTPAPTNPATDTPAPTNTATDTSSAMITHTPTLTPVPSDTLTAAPTDTPTETASPVRIATATSTESATEAVTEFGVLMVSAKK